MTSSLSILRNLLFKTLFSFAGMGVVIDVTQEDIDRITDAGNWILQEEGAICVCHPNNG